MPTLKNIIEEGGKELGKIWRVNGGLFYDEIKSFLSSREEIAYRAGVKYIKENVDDFTYAIQIENRGNKSYFECRLEAYERIINNQLKANKE